MANEGQNGACPLCGGMKIREPIVALKREFLQCATCEFWFVPEKYHISAERQKARYELHNNRLDDAGYVAHLSRLADPVLSRLSPGAVGLDYGSGPAPGLSELFRTKGFHTECYDIYFNPDTGQLNRKYDFIVLSETAEHFEKPADEWTRLGALLKPGGILGVMTSLVKPGTDWSRWRYANDETHIGFYSDRTMNWLAARYSWRIEMIEDPVILFRPEERVA
jgi:hypothetical protein